MTSFCLWLQSGGLPEAQIPNAPVPADGHLRPLRERCSTLPVGGWQALLRQSINDAVGLIDLACAGIVIDRVCLPRMNLSQLFDHALAHNVVLEDRRRAGCRRYSASRR